MEGFDGTNDEKKAVIDLLTQMGYTVAEEDLCPPSGGVAEVQKDFLELGQTAFMKSIPKGSGVRARAAFSRFLKSLEAQPDAGKAGEAEAKALPEDERFHLMLHNIVKGEDDRNVTIRVVHHGRFVDYTLDCRRYAKLVLPKESSFHLLCNISGAKFHQFISEKSMSVMEKGSLVLAHSWHHLEFAVRPALGPQDATTSTYYFCGPSGEELKLWHTPPGEPKSEGNQIRLKKLEYKVVVPEERAQVHLESFYRIRIGLGKNRSRIEERSEDMQLPVMSYSGKHVYIFQDQEHLSADPAEPADELNAADLEAVVDTEDQKIRGFHVRLHHASAENEKFQLQVKVTLPDDQEADFQLDSHCSSVLRLPLGSWLEVHCKSQEHPEAPTWNPMIITADELQKLDPGSNIYFASEHDHEHRTEEEDQLFTKLCPLMLLFPLWLLVIIILGCLVEGRKKKHPQCRLHHLLGSPSKGKPGPSSTMWHFCSPPNCADRMFIQPETQGKDREQDGFALVWGESRAVASADSVLTVRKCVDFKSHKNDTVLKEQTAKVAASKFENRHAYVWWDDENGKAHRTNYTDGFVGIFPGASLSDTPVWDAFQKREVDTVDLEAGNGPSNMPSNMPANTSSENGSRPPIPGTVESGSAEA